jgi:hypothetical protein
MTFGTLAFFETVLKLTFMGVRLMTIGANREHQGPLEVPIQMALGTDNLCMQPKQWILGLRVVEFKSR